MLSGAGYDPEKEYVPKRIAGYTERGIDYRWDFTFEDLSPAFPRQPAGGLLRHSVHRAQRNG